MDSQSALVASGLAALSSLLVCAATAFATGATASAEPALRIEPDFSKYAKIDFLEQFAVVDVRGVWFTSPLGLPCGIAKDGSFGCSGGLPGVPPGMNEVGWIPGDSAPRIYSVTDDPGFARGARQGVMPINSYVEYNGSRCAVTQDSGVNCLHGNDTATQINITATVTLIGDRSTPP